MAVRTLIVDDSPVARKVLRHRFENRGFEVVGEASTAAEGLELFRTLRPRLVTLDLVMPKVGEEIDSKALFRVIRKERPEVAIVCAKRAVRGLERAEYLHRGAIASRLCSRSSAKSSLSPAAKTSSAVPEMHYADPLLP